MGSLGCDEDRSPVEVHLEFMFIAYGEKGEERTSPGAWSSLHLTVPHSDKNYTNTIPIVCSAFKSAMPFASDGAGKLPQKTNVTYALFE